ncbi:hypothetical protein M885DRAFT_346772 [Pelagophyceae sp. CCMP2097]|nr:hypothetical protein M885DRAFT_346772 [Pelagophyceae sp. CCMP2097]
MRRLACAALVSVGAALTAPRPRLARRGVSVRAEVTSPAAGVAAVLAEVWSQLTLNAEVDEDVTILFPNAFLDETQRSLLPALYEHLECCKDVSDRFGTRVVAVPSPPGSATAVTLRRIGGASRVDDWADDDDFEVSPELLAKIAALSASDENDDYYASGGDDDEDEVAPLPERPPASDVEVLELSRAWVDAIVSGAGVCPFSVDAGRAGLPVGNVRYEVSRADSAEAAYAAYWREVDIIDQSDERSLSTTLLILADERWTRNYEEFETFGGTLAQALQSCDEGGASGLGFEDEFQLVFFHPNHVFRDGRDRSGKDGAANFARRSPWPMINILRTNQVKAAQKGLPTALVYAQNEATLAVRSSSTRARNFRREPGCAWQPASA